MNPLKLTFTANEQDLTKTDNFTDFASNTVSYIEATFTLGENWSGYDSVRAVWKTDYYTISTVLDANFTCIVPTEVLRYKAKVFVNLVGSIVENDTLTDRLTTFPVLALTVKANAAVNGSETAPVTPSQFEQFVDSVRDAAGSISDYSYDSEAWAVGTRGGVDVPSTDPTYHNNSKYWAEQNAGLADDVADLSDDVADLKSDIEKVVLAYGEKTVELSDNNNVSVVIGSTLTTVVMSDRNLFSSAIPLYIENVKTKGFEFSGVNSFPSTIGFIFGKDASNNYYFVSCAKTAVGQIFKVTPQGSYTRIIDSIKYGTDIDRVVVDDFTNGVLTVRFYDVDNEYIESYTADVSSYSVTKSVVGFVGYNASEYTIKVPTDILGYIYKPLLEYANIDPKGIFCDIVLSSSAKKIALIGDSITQGVGSTGYVEYNTIIDGHNVSVRGNGPDYPDAGPGYQVGQLLYDNYSRIWYEALDGNGWAQKLKAYIEAKYSNIIVKNYGMSGIDSSNLSAFMPSLVSGFDYIIIAIGTNDRDNASRSTLYNNLKSCVTTLIENGQKVVLIGNIPASIANEQIASRVVHMEDIVAVVNKVAKDTRVPFIDLFDAFKDYCKYTETSINSLLADGLHPNDAGYEVMFNLICANIGIPKAIDGATWIAT